MNVKQGFIALLAAVGIYSIYEWYTTNKRSPGGPNPVASEVGGKVRDTNFTSSNQMTSGVPGFNTVAIANGHGDQVAASQHSNRYSIANGSPNYEPAFGPSTNGGGGVQNGTRM
jgi:hypothetical protein